jgi:hypothetical protein
MSAQIKGRKSDVADGELFGGCAETKDALATANATYFFVLCIDGIKNVE